ncbi:MULTISPECIES: LA2681 family HEPN domain-containing protein [Acinetobacter]|uniref:LA2681 family HEPN domain-containing protein n=2 Tax=Moraxellaceae TaxID=468 RepID=UPI0015D38D0D|nr:MULTISPECIES: LA2681 family HEPN domain-containing protein [Acinetobacter]MCL6242579.1 LA2681 family HEPN domain-containing protein [Acinetobacter amyesii]
MTYKINSSLSLKESLVYHSNFDELRNEYTYARFLIFQASEIKTDTQHFYNKTYPHVYDTLHAIDNLKTSQMKSAFRILYSIFDKISYFLAKYLDLEMNDRQITFSKVFGWNENRKFKPRDKLKDSKNYFLHALFYILKEIESDQLNGHDKVSELNSREKIEKPRLSKIRNCLEHRSFRVIDDFGYELNTKFDMTSEFAYQNLKDQQNILIEQGEVESFEYLEILEKIKEKEMKANYILEIPLSEFESSLMDLVRLVRNSLMYLSFAVQFEEKMKPQPEGLILQREIPLK